ncbi:hypothetical protein ACHAWF_017293 [Thalassiosira exigua]
MATAAAADPLASDDDPPPPPAVEASEAAGGPTAVDDAEAEEGGGRGAEAEEEEDVAILDFRRVYDALRRCEAEASRRGRGRGRRRLGDDAPSIPLVVPSSHPSARRILDELAALGLGFVDPRRRRRRRRRGEARGEECGEGARERGRGDANRSRGGREGRSLADAEGAKPTLRPKQEHDDSTGSGGEEPAAEVAEAGREEPVRPKGEDSGSRGDAGDAATPKEEEAGVVGDAKDVATENGGSAGAGNRKGSIPLKEEDSSGTSDKAGDAATSNGGSSANVESWSVTRKPKEEERSDAAGDGAVAGSAAAGGRRKSSKLKGKCDLCAKGDGVWGNLQRCRTCRLLVHERCYGLVETDKKDPDFACRACRAAGTEVEVNVPSRVGGCGKKMGRRREKVKQAGRPAECVLCAHRGGAHAMHPLFDAHGPEGRQLAIEVPGEGKRLAWVHTLCASVIGSNPRTRGSVYGCDEEGNYYGCDDEGSSEEEEEEEEFVNKDEDKGCEGEVDGKGDDEGRLSPRSDEDGSGEGEESVVNDHFVIASEGGWAKNIKQHRRMLDCHVCGTKRKQHDLMIPLQCIAGDDEEDEALKKRHPRGTECFEAVHVGCARWGCVEMEGSHIETIDGAPCNRCFFSPGSEYTDNRTIACCYCQEHARDLVLRDPNRKKASNAGKAKEGKTTQPGRKQPAFQPREPVSESAQSSFRKSIRSIRRRPGNKKNILKKKSDEKKPSERKFGAQSPNKATFSQRNSVRFPARGRSANALAGPSTEMPTRAPSERNHNLGEASADNPPGRLKPGILKKGAVAGKRKADPVPDHHISGSIKRMKQSESENSMSGPEPDLHVSGSSERKSGKRKADPFPDLPVSESFKRVKAEH